MNRTNSRKYLGSNDGSVQIAGPMPGPYALDIVKRIKRDAAQHGLKYQSTERNPYTHESVLTFTSITD